MSKVAPRRRSGGPLTGYRVLELCTTVAGPACARLMGDFGAEVIKLESPEGDPVRSMGFHEGDVSLYAATILRNKKSIAVDLKTSKGRELARSIAAKCDVVVENFRPGKLEKLGLGYSTLSKDNPRCVLVRISGYGQTGPYRDKPGYGTVCEAFAGVRHVTGFPDRPPARVSVALTDYVTALYAAYGAVMALLEVERTGRGQIVETALYEAAFSLLEPDVPAFDRLGRVANREGSSFPGLAPNNLYTARDGKHVLVAANNNAVFHRLCIAMGMPELPEDPRFKSIRSRATHVTEIDQIVAKWVGTRDGKVSVALLEAAQVPTSLVYTMEEAFVDPQYRARRTLVRRRHPALGSVAMAGLVSKFSETPGRIRSVGPEVGSQTRSVLRSLLNLSTSEIAELERTQVVKSEPKWRKPK